MTPDTADPSRSPSSGSSPSRPSGAPAPGPRSPWRQAGIWAARIGLANKLAVALAAAAAVAGVATYAVLTSRSAQVSAPTDPRTVTRLLTLDLILLLLLGAVIARRIVAIWLERRRGLAGSRLHVRLIALFTVLAVAPAILVAVFSTMFFFLGVQSWFSDRVRTAVNESLAVAQAYLHEHQQLIRADVLSMANELDRLAPELSLDPQRFQRVLANQAFVRSLSEAVVFDGSGRILAQAGLTLSLQFDPIPDSALQRARQGQVVLMINDSDDRVRALVRLDRYIDAYLFVGRLVEPKVLTRLSAAQNAVKEYQALQDRRSSLQITVTLIYVVVALLLLLAAVWLGLQFATQLVTPIGALIGAAERVRAGDLAVRVPESEPEDEIGSLSRAFNRMTDQLATQRRELMEANRQLDLRRRFTETVLAGVSAGVIGLDQDGRINLPNLSAAMLLSADREALIGQLLTEAAPEMEELMTAIRRRPGRLVDGQVQLRRPGTAARTLLVRIAADLYDGDERAGEIRGFVVTFDDVTELVAAQRKAAWADVARRIAHEIKNPLTPIQLSAERLRRKYLREITSDPETFRACTDTIVRQVDDIGRMVDEFSAFARMPSPVMRPTDLGDLVRQAVVLQSTAHQAIRFSTELPPRRAVLNCDGRQLSQALTNLLQNAIDAIEGRDGGDLPPGEISVRLVRLGDGAEIVVEDNGKGLPVDERDRLTEPYVTTRAKGTGLGLAIVRKIMEDHGGNLVLEDRDGGGARVRLVIPDRPDEAPGEPQGEPTVALAEGAKQKHSHGA